MGDVRTTLARVIALPKKRSLTERDLVSWGGYGLQMSPCVEGTASCGDSCCPNGYKCTSSGDHKNNFNPTEAICCPTDTDCTTTVKVVPACADTSWGLYHAFGEFCCPSDMVGIYPEGGTGPLCMSGSLPIPADKLASKVRQATTANGAVATPISSKTASASSGTITSASDSQNSNPAGVTNNSLNPSSKSGLSQSATIAIAVLAATLGLVLILVIGYFWRKKRRSKGQAPSSLDPPSTQPVNEFAHPPAPEKGSEAQPFVEAKAAEFQVKELSGENTLYSAPNTELDAPARAELYTPAQNQ